ncbi:MAG: hypothetical protein ACRD9R_04885 [Pyrinomonadaceae bacterium]
MKVFLLEFLILFVTVPRSIYPLAKAQKQDALLWTFIAAGVFVLVELIVVGLYAFISFLGVYFFGLLGTSNKQQFVSLVHTLALVGGLTGVEAVRRQLGERQPSTPTPPPPPETF